MSWTTYPQGTLDQMCTPPLEGSDGNMWLVSGVTVSVFNTPVIFSVQTPGGGAPSQFNSYAWPNGSNKISNLVTDGTYMSVAGSDNFPANFFQSVVISTQALAAHYFNNPDDGFRGAVRIGSKTYVVGGDTTPTPTIYEFTTATATVVNANSFGSGGDMGCPVYDGSVVWAAVGGTTTMYAIDPSTLSAVGTYTLAANAMSVTGLLIAPQTGFDGRYIYLAADAGGVIVFDTTTNTSSVVGSTPVVNCFYSNNMGEVYLDDTSQNIYTMPAGGGSLTNVGNKNTITGETILNSGGFGDGPGGSVWASGNKATGLTYMLEYSGTSMKIIGVI